MIKLNTDYCIIREYDESDLENYLKLFMNEKVQRYLPHLRNMCMIEHNNNFQSLLKDLKNNNRKQYRFVVLEKSTFKFIGEVGFIITNKTPKGCRAELGYFSLPEYWGKGYMIKCVNQIIQFAFEQCSVHKLTAGCLKENEASSSILRKCKMKKEGEFKEHVWIDESWNDNVKYGLLKSDWELSQQV